MLSRQPLAVKRSSPDEAGLMIDPRHLAGDSALLPLEGV